MDKWFWRSFRGTRQFLRVHSIILWLTSDKLLHLAIGILFFQSTVWILLIQIRIGNTLQTARMINWCMLWLTDHPDLFLQYNIVSSFWFNFFFFSVLRTIFKKILFAFALIILFAYQKTQKGTRATNGNSSDNFICPTWRWNRSRGTYESSW